MFFKIINEYNEGAINDGVLRTCIIIYLMFY